MKTTPLTKWSAQICQASAEFIVLNMSLNVVLADDTMLYDGADVVRVDMDMLYRTEDYHELYEESVHITDFQFIVGIIDKII